MPTPPHRSAAQSRTLAGAKSSRANGGEGPFDSKPPCRCSCRCSKLLSLLEDIHIGHLSSIWRTNGQYVYPPGD